MIFSKTRSSVGFYTKQLLCVFPPLLSIILVLYIVHIIDTDLSTYCASKKQKKNTQMHISPLIMFSPGAHLFLPCGMYILTFLNPLKKLQNSVNTQNCNYPISCHLHWREKEKQNASERKKKNLQKESWKRSSCWWWARHCMHAYVNSRYNNSVIFEGPSV